MSSPPDPLSLRVLTPCLPLPSGEGELAVGPERLAQRRFEVLSTGISVAHSNDAIARTFQEPSPRLVVASLRFSIVHVPLELDHNPFTGAIEIHNKAVQYVLSPKLEPEDAAVAQQRPGVTLSWRRVVAQLAGARKSLGRAETTKRIHRLSVANSGMIYATKVL